MEEVQTLNEPASREDETQKDSHGTTGNMLKHTTIPGAGPPAKRAKYSPPFQNSFNRREKSQVENSSSDEQNYDSGMLLCSSTKLENECKTEEKFCKNDSEFMTHPVSSTSRGENTSEEASICISRTGSESLDDSGDDRMDASNLVLSVIKTKVDIQTMKMCLQHNSDAFSARGSAQSGPLPQSPPTEGAQGVSELRTRHLQADVEPEPPLRSWPNESPGGSPILSCSCSMLSCNACSSRENQPDVHRGVQGRTSNHLELWQDQHTAKAIVDNAINRTIEEMVIAPDVSSPTGAQDQSQMGDDEERVQQRLQERLEPVINQLTQASELVFARNIEQSKSTSFHSRDEIDSLAEGGIDQR